MLNFIKSLFKKPSKDISRDRLGKTLWTARKDGEKVRLIGHWDGEEEARIITDEIEQHSFTF